MTEKIENTSREVKLVDDLGDPIPTACDNTSHVLSWQEVNALADALEHAEYIEAVPSLQNPWGQASHPLLTSTIALGSRSNTPEPRQKLPSIRSIPIPPFMKNVRPADFAALSIYGRASEKQHRDFCWTRKYHGDGLEVRLLDGESHLVPRQKRPQQYCIIDGQRSL